jgi:V/A-type H+-transporting ATPase subunit I
MLLSMTRIQIIGAKQCRPKTIQLLHRLGVVQINEWDQSRALSQQRMSLSGETVHLRERLAYRLTQVEAVLTALPALNLQPSAAYDDYSNRPSDWLLEHVKTDLNQVESTAQEITSQRHQLEEQFSALPRYEATLRRLAPLVPELVDLENFTVTAIWLERRYQETLEAITRRLERLTNGQCEIISRQVDSDTLAAVLVFPKTQAEAVGRFLGQENISQVRLPTEFSDQPLQQALTDIRERLEAIPRELAEIEHRQESLARQWRPQMLTWQALLRDHLAQIDVCNQLGQTDYTFVLEGWLPKERLAEVQDRLAQEIGGNVIVTEIPLSADDATRAPVAFDNPTFVKPFEPLVQLLALPQYGGFDPTPLMAVFMPIFFGMILGDVAYGIILLALMAYLRRRFKTRATLRSLAEVLMLGSAWSILFGFLFGEFLGTLGEDIGLHPLWFDRAHNVQGLFLLTIGIGAGHIVLGLGLGVWEALRHHARRELMEKVAMLVSLAALFLLVAVLTGFLPNSFFTPVVAILVVGVAVLIYSMGSLGLLLGPLELLGTVGNILSYLRIAAIGLSSIYLAQVANELAGFVGSLLVGLIIAVLFHALNIALGAFSPTIQSLRLHYVEFFGKFYTGGGEPFRPFKRSLTDR